METDIRQIRASWQVHLPSVCYWLFSRSPCEILLLLNKLAVCSHKPAQIAKYFHGSFASILMHHTRRVSPVFL